MQSSHAKTIRDVGSASIILLKNDNKTLPLQSIQKMAIIGDDAGPNAG